MFWFSVTCFWFQNFGDVSPYVCSYYFSSVLVAGWPSFGVAAHSVDHMFALYFDYLYYCLFPVLVFRVGFEFWFSS